MFRVALFFSFLGSFVMAQSLQVPNQKTFSTSDLELLIQNKIELGCNTMNDSSYYAELLTRKNPDLEVLYLLFRAQDAANCFDRINPKSEQWYKEALKKSRLVSTELWVYTQLQYANYLYYFRDMTRAFNYYLAIDQTLEKGKMDDPIRLDFTYQSLGYFYGTIGANRAAVVALNEALALSKPTSNQRAAIFDAIGNQYLELGDLEKADQWFNSAIHAARRAKDELRYAKVLGNQARIALRKQNFAKAEALLIEDIEISTRLKASMNIMYAKTFLSQLYYEIGAYEKAEENLSDATQLYRSKPYYATNGIGIEKQKLRLYKTTNQNSKLLSTYESIVQLENFVETLDGPKALSNANVLYQRLKLQQAESENKVKKEILMRRQIFFTVIFVLILLLGLYIFMYYRKLAITERLTHLHEVKNLELKNLRIETQLAQANTNLGVQVRYIKNKNLHVQNLRLEIIRAQEAEKELLEYRRSEVGNLLSAHLMTKETW